MADKKYVVINRGPRTFDLKDGPDGKKRALLPGHSIECLDEPEYKHLMNYFREVADMDKVAPANAKRADDLQKQVDALTADNARLTAEAKEPAVVESKPEPEPVARHKKEPEPAPKHHKKGK